MNTLQMRFNTDKDDWNNKHLVIDGEGHWVKSYQTTIKISDYEYKIYQLYLLTDKELGNKTDFILTLKSNQLKNKADDSYVTKDTGMFLVNTPNNERTINLDGEFNVEVSKEKALGNSKIIDNINQEVSYKKMTEKIEKVTITPMQIVAKVVATINDVSSNSLASVRHKDHIGILEFRTYDENGTEINNLNTETKRVVTYKNGKSEEWATGDIEGKTFSDGKMELTYYIIIEKKNDMKGLTIVPTAREVQENGKEITVELDGKFNIDLE